MVKFEIKRSRLPFPNICIYEEWTLEKTGSMWIELLLLRKEIENMYSLFIREFIFEMNNKRRQELLDSVGGINWFLPTRGLNYGWAVKETYNNEDDQY